MARWSRPPFAESRHFELAVFSAPKSAPLFGFRALTRKRQAFDGRQEPRIVTAHRRLLVASKPPVVTSVASPDRGSRVEEIRPGCRMGKSEKRQATLSHAPLLFPLPNDLACGQGFSQRFERLA